MKLYSLQPKKNKPLKTKDRPVRMTSSLRKSLLFRSPSNLPINKNQREKSNFATRLSKHSKASKTDSSKQSRNKIEHSTSLHMFEQPNSMESKDSKQNTISIDSSPKLINIKENPDVKDSVSFYELSKSKEPNEPLITNDNFTVIKSARNRSSSFKNSSAKLKSNTNKNKNNDQITLPPLLKHHNSFSGAVKSKNSKVIKNSKIKVMNQFFGFILNLGTKI